MKYIKLFEYLKIGTYVVVNRTYDKKILLIRVSNMSGYVEFLSGNAEKSDNNRLIRFRQQKDTEGKYSYRDVNYVEYKILYTSMSLEKAKKQFDLLTSADKYNL